MRFSEMEVGDIAVVETVAGDGPFRKRILDLGITRGTEVELIRVAPLGDPVEIELRGYRLTLRKSEALCVELRPAGHREAEE